MTEVTLELLEEALEHSWWRDTAANSGARWDACCPDIDQCAVTAMVVQDYFGGDLLRCPMSTPNDSHYWNRLPDKREIDLTYKQMECLGEEPYKSDYVVRERSYVECFPNTMVRYSILKGRVKEYFRLKEAFHKLDDKTLAVLMYGVEHFFAFLYLKEFSEDFKFHSTTIYSIINKEYEDREIHYSMYEDDQI